MAGLGPSVNFVFALRALAAASFCTSTELDDAAWRENRPLGHHAAKMERRIYKSRDNADICFMGLFITASVYNRSTP